MDRADTSTVRIGQLTDIHVADFADLRRRHFVGKRATGWVNFTRKRIHEYERRIVDASVARLVEEAPDLVVVSGDLTNLGLASELHAALGVLAPLKEAGIRTVVIPGNHDYYTVGSASGQFEEICADWQRADVRDAGMPYPFVVRTGPVAVVCFNSGIPTPPLLAYGLVDREQLARAERLIAMEKDAGRAIVFAVHHHPTRAPHHKREWPRGLRNVPAFRALAARSGATLIFHGHNHFWHQRRLREAEDVCVVGISCATTNRATPAARVAQVGLYEVDARGLQRAAVSSWRDEAFGDWVWTRPAEMPLESEHEALTS